MAHDSLGTLIEIRDRLTVGGSGSSAASEASLASIDAKLSSQTQVNARSLATRIWLSGIYSASGDTTIIAAPAAGVQIVIAEIRIQNNVTSGQTALLKRGAADSTPMRLRMVADGSGLSEAYTNGNELRLGAATAFVLNLSAATAVGLSVRYWFETVSTGLPL